MLSAANATGFKDEGVVAFRDGTTTQFLNTEDALNNSSLFSACDLSFRDAAGNRSAISQLEFAEETQTQLDVVLAANRPIDGTYTIAVEEMTWNEGCAFITLEGDSVAMPLEEGFLTTVELDGNSNNTRPSGRSPWFQPPAPKCLLRVVKAKVRRPSPCCLQATVLGTSP